MPADRQFLSEPIEPDPETFAPGNDGAGSPLVPRRFLWRERAYEITAVERAWKTTDAAHTAGANAYLRRHWAEVVTACGERMRIYAERGGRPRWFLHSRVR